MIGFFDARQLSHAPVRELQDGDWVPYAEVPTRAEAVLAAVGPLARPDDRGEAPIRAVHDAAYLAFLRTAAERWRAEGRAGDAIGYAWPIVARRAVALERIDALLGRYTMDAGTPLTPDSWTASYWSAQSALAAASAAVSSAGRAFALCRPPGHHAGRDYAGGYCHLNAVAIAAQAAIDGGAGRVAILDIDYHHGNGTQDIFWRRGDVFFASLHADPATDFPFYWGHSDERGAGEGEGATLNLPLPRGTALIGFRRALARALDAVARFGPDLLLVSFGADTWIGDPLGHFALASEDYGPIARDIAGGGWPTAVVLEGGYALDALGRNVAEFLKGLDAGPR